MTQKRLFDSSGLLPLQPRLIDPKDEKVWNRSHPFWRVSQSAHKNGAKLSQPTVRSLASYKSAALLVSEHTTAWSNSSGSHESGGKQGENNKLHLCCSLKEKQHLFSIYTVFPVCVSPKATLRYTSLGKYTALSEQSQGSHSKIPDLVNLAIRI